MSSYLPLIQKGSSTHMHDLVAYVKEELPFSRNLPLGKTADSYFCFRLALLHLVSYFSFLYQSHLLCLYGMVFDSISCKKGLKRPYSDG